jgi:hypothetical protein
MILKIDHYPVTYCVTVICVLGIIYAHCNCMVEVDVMVPYCALFPQFCIA